MRGGDKLLELVDGRTLLRERAEAALAVSDRVIVVLNGAEGRLAALEGLAVEVVAGSEAGMAVSLRAGLRALPEAAEAVLVVLGDMPEVSSADMARVIETFQADGARPITCGGCEGRPGHPVLFPRRNFEELEAVDGDRGGRALIRAHGARIVDLAPGHATTDLDTPEAWAAWRARTGR